MTTLHELREWAVRDQPLLQKQQSSSTMAAFIKRMKRLKRRSEASKKDRQTYLSGIQQATKHSRYAVSQHDIQGFK